VSLNIRGEALILQQKSVILDSPVFVVGPLRSGTTLLRLLLDHHPEINMFGEFEGAVSQAVGDDWPDLDQLSELLNFR
jgi:hypothetical protein